MEKVIAYLTPGLLGDSPIADVWPADFIPSTGDYVSIRGVLIMVTAVLWKYDSQQTVKISAVRVEPRDFPATLDFLTHH
jgi:hypothetical protein